MASLRKEECEVTAAVAAAKLDAEAAMAWATMHRLLSELHMT